MNNTSEKIVTVYELSDNFELSRFQTDKITAIAPMIDAMLMDYVNDGDLKEGEEYQLTIKITKMTVDQYNNLPEYQF
jgi:hypothetical protein